MRSRLASSSSKVAAVALLGIVVALPWQLVAAPVIARLSELRDGIARERALLGNYQAVLTEAGRRERESGAAGRKQQPAAQFLAGASEAIRMAGLQSTINGHAQQAGIRLASVRPLPPRQQGELRLIGVRVELTASLASVQALLHALEAGTPWLLIEHAQLAPARSSREGTSGDAAAVDVRLDIYGGSARKG